MDPWDEAVLPSPTVKGRIDIVFANAGVGEFVPFGAVTEVHGWVPLSVLT